MYVDILQMLLFIATDCNLYKGKVLGYLAQRQNIVTGTTRTVMPVHNDSD